MLFRSVYKPQTSLCVCYCGWCGCATTSHCECIFLGKSKAKQLSSGSHPQVYPFIILFTDHVLCIGKKVLVGIILALFLGIFILGFLTLSNLYDTPILDWSMEFNTKMTKSIKADTNGPGLDARQDGAMFVTMVYELPNCYHVGLYDNRNVNIANSASVYQIQNRLYIGQFNELEHLKDGILTKAIPCSRAFSFLDRIDKSLFDLKSSFLHIDFSNCKLIFRLRYYPNNHDWSPFRKYIWHNYITVEWGIYIKDKETCPIGFAPLPVSSLLTDTVKQDIINYTCSPSCINATDACREARYGRFVKSRRKWRFFDDYLNNLYAEGNITEFLSDPRMANPAFYLTINDQHLQDLCFFRTNFRYSWKFCDKFWADFQPVKVPDFVKHLYPQFITIHMTYI